MGMVHDVKLPSEPRNWFIAGDWHSYYVFIAAVNILIKHALLLPKDQRNLIINGDFLDLAFMMPNEP